MSFVSKLMIGTAQFGQVYGVMGANEKVPNEQIKAILYRGRKHGVCSIDTARGYGESENVLGRLGVEHFRITTKLSSTTHANGNYRNFFSSEIKSSLRNLNVHQLDTVLLHRPEELLQSDGEQIYDALLSLKTDELTKNIGLSIYDPNILEPILSKYQIDIVQAPLNVFDQRLIRSGWLSKLVDRNIKIQARSIFLQGLLANPVDQLPPYFLQWKDNFLLWHEYCKNHAMTPLQGCLQFVARIPEVQNIIVGVDSEAQFVEIIKSLNWSFDGEWAQFTNDDLNLISPIHWNH